MKLTDIDLNDKTEVAAAHALLAAVLGVQFGLDSTTLQHDVIHKAPRLDASQNFAGMTGEQVVSTIRAEIDRPASQVFAQPGTLPAGAQPMQDAAAVFGASPLASSLGGTPALYSAGAVPSAIAPGVHPGSSAEQPIASPAPAPMIAAAALVPGGVAAMGQPAVPTNPAPGVELDKNGLPWDARIHASTKSKKKDGTWTALRGMNDEARVKQIEAELRASVATQSAAPFARNSGFADRRSGCPMQALPGLAISGATAASADPVTFEQLMPRVTQATIAQILPPTALQQVCGLLGLPSVVALQTNPAYVPHAWAQLKAAYPALQ